MLKMRFFFGKITALSIIMLIAGMSARAQTAIGAISSIQAHNVIWESKLYSQVEFLSDSLCGGRATGTTGSTEAAFWIIRRFREIGLLPFGESYSKHFSGPSGRNIIGFLPGSSRSHRKKYVVVMAHYDGIGTLEGTLYPGADSNASGVVAMSGIAEMFSAMRHLGRAYSTNFIFAALDAKSSGMKGSAELWRMIEDGLLEDPVDGHRINADEIGMAVNIDQVGGVSSTLKSGRKDFLIMLGDDSGNGWKSSLLKSCNITSGTMLELGFDYYGSANFTEVFYRRISDQRIFIEHGIPAVMFTSGITMNNNKPCDNVQSLDMTILKRRIWLMFHWIEKAM